MERLSDQLDKALDDWWEEVNKARVRLVILKETIEGLQQGLVKRIYAEEKAGIIPFYEELFKKNMQQAVEHMEKANNLFKQDVLKSIANYKETMGE